MVTSVKNSNHSWIPANQNGGVAMDNISLDENDLNDSDLMTAIGADDDQAVASKVVGERKPLLRAAFVDLLEARQSAVATMKTKRATHKP